MDIEEAFCRAWELQLKGKDRQAEAEGLLRGVLKVKPDHEGALRQYGLLLCENGRPDEAIAYLHDALAYDPNYAATWTCLGAVYSKQGRDAEAIEALGRACQLATNQPSARYNRATPLLRQGRWHEGWQDYQYGQACGVRHKRFQRPEWDGWSDIEGRTLYLWSEQGYGDTIMCLQLLALVRARYRPARIIVEVQRELVALLKASYSLADEVLPQPTDYHEPRPFDAHCSLMSLPAALNLTQDDLPAARGYIRSASPEKHEGFRVGVCWRGRPEHENDRNRSMTAEDFAPVAALPGVECYPLTPEEGRLRHWGETAALIGSLDLVLTVDTAVAHLAGAMGVPTRILLPAVSDFRWLTGRGDTPWYPSARLVRQETAGAWGPVVARVAKEMEAWHRMRPYLTLTQ